MRLHFWRLFYHYYTLKKDIKSKIIKKRENLQKNTKITIEQKQKMIYNPLSKERENANNKTNRRSI